MINLKDFCGDAKDEPRTNLHTPWYEGEYVYATNGHMLVRVKKSLGYDGIPKNRQPDCEAIISQNQGTFLPVTWEEIETALQSVHPHYQDVHTLVPCPDCKNGQVICVCEECEHEHYRDCLTCHGDGEVESGQIEGRMMLPTPVPFRAVHIQWGYLKLIADTMKEMGGTWEVATQEPLAYVHFKSADAYIVCMPMRVGAGRVS